jgi:hypothetical protein
MVSNHRLIRVAHARQIAWKHLAAIGFSFLGDKDGQTVQIAFSLCINLSKLTSPLFLFSILFSSYFFN